MGDNHSMGVEDKINESDFFLKKIEYEIKNDNEIEAKYYFSAFLSAARSIIDFLFSDLSEKYGLDIDLDSNLTHGFIKKAKDTNNLEAIEFNKNFWKKFEILTKDKICSIMLNNRKINTHRKTVPPRTAAYTLLPEVDEKIGYLRIETNSIAADKKIKTESKKFFKEMAKEIPSSLIPTVNKNTIWVLENTNYELINSCNHFISFIKKFVLEIQNDWKDK